MPLLTLMMTGSGDRRSGGRKAVVVRTTPARLASKRFMALVPDKVAGRRKDRGCRRC